MNRMPRSSSSLGGPSSVDALSGSGRRSAATSSSSVSIVSWASFLLVPITPLGPRLIGPRRTGPGPARSPSPITRPRSLGMTPDWALVGGNAVDARFPGSRWNAGPSRTRSSRWWRWCGPGRSRDFVHVELVDADDDPVPPCRRPGSRAGVRGTRELDPLLACPAGSGPEDPVRLSMFLRLSVVGGIRFEERAGRCIEGRTATGSTITSASVSSPSSQHLAGGGGAAPVRGRAGRARGPPRCRWTTASDLDRVVGGIGALELVAQQPHRGDVGGDVAVADHDDALAGEVEIVVARSRDGRCTRRRTRWPGCDPGSSSPGIPSLRSGGRRHRPRIGRVGSSPQARSRGRRRCRPATLPKNR